MERWSGKVAVVTGASSGIGLATAKQLVQNGLIVIGLARREDKMEKELKDVKGPGEFYAKKCDITDEKKIIEVFDWIKSTFKSLHILINNAGVVKLNTIEVAPTEDLENIFKVNVFGLLYCTKHAIKLMRETQSHAHIININSELGHKIPSLKSNCSSNIYPATKFAVTALSETLRHELSDTKIRVTSISPAATRTEMSEPFLKNIPILEDIPVLEPEDVSNSIMHALGAPPHVEIDEISLSARHP